MERETERGSREDQTGDLKRWSEVKGERQVSREELGTKEVNRETDSSEQRRGQRVWCAQLGCLLTEKREGGWVCQEGTAFLLGLLKGMKFSHPR